MPCSPLSNTLLGGHLTCRVTLCHLPKAFGHVLGNSGTEMEPLPEGSLRAAHGTAQDLSEGSR